MNWKASTVGPRVGSVSGSGIGSPGSVTATASRLKPPVSDAPSSTLSVFSPAARETVVDTVAHSSQ